MDAYDRRGFGLRELLVVVAIVFLGFCLLVPAINDAREAGRRTQCQSNIRQLGMALTNFHTARGHFPNAGTFADDPAVHGGDPLKSNIYLSITHPETFTVDRNPYRYNWVVDMFPFFDCGDDHSSWDSRESYLSARPKGRSHTTNAGLSGTSINALTCPDDVTREAGKGNLSYVVNGGFSRWPAVPVGWTGGKEDGESHNGGVLSWTAPESTWQERQAVGKKLGVMFLGTSSHDQPWDISTTMDDIVDGTAYTLLLGENTLAGYSKGTAYSGGLPTNWACPLPNFCMFLASDDVCHSATSATDCTGGQLRPLSLEQGGPGWARANASGTFENIGYGQALKVEGSFPFATSGHPGGANFTFCDGHVSFLTSSIDGDVYARLITPAGEGLPKEIRQRKLKADDSFKKEQRDARQKEAKR